MKIAVCSKDKNENSLIANRFARAEYFIIFDTETNEIKPMKNVAVSAAGGASGQAVRVLDKESVNVVLCPEVGPKAMEALGAFEIKAYNFSTATTVNEALEMYIANKLPLITASHTKQYKR